MTLTSAKKTSAKGGVKFLFSDIDVIPTVLNNSQYPSLNGLRGVAILMVLVCHLRLGDSVAFRIIFNGPCGVLIFFVISGFLITTLCIKEKVITGGFSLKQFYIRRALRIFPVAYLYIAAIIILNHAYKLGISYKSILGAAFYVMDISSYFKRYFSFYTDHFWSLSVEEQFYLIVPFILKSNFRTYLLSILFIIFVLPVIICLQYLFPALNNNFLYAFTHLLVKFQAIAVGCLFSVLLFKYPLYDVVFKRFKFIGNLAAVIIILILQYDGFFTLQDMFSGLLISFLVGYIIITNISPAKNVFFWLLNNKALATIGILSYSLYIWHSPFTANDKRLPFFMNTYPYNIISIIIISCLSYYCYERVFLKIKSRFSKIKSRPVVAVVDGPVS